MRASHRALGNRRGLAATVVTGVLALSGIVSIGSAVAAAHFKGPSPVPRAVDSTGLPAREVSDDRAARLAGALKVVGPVMRRSAPVSLAVPAIGVRSSLVNLGQTAKGAMQTPAPGRDYNKAGWYKYSPTPGSLGPAVIAGHIDSAKDGPSVFYRLSSLRAHDTIRVTRADGSVATFTVNSVGRYAKDRFPTKLVYGNTNHAGLRLITCGGAFDRSSGNYVDNIVVFASLVRATDAKRPPASQLPD